MSKPVAPVFKNNIMLIIYIFFLSVALLFLAKKFLKDNKFIFNNRKILIFSLILLTFVTRLIWINVVNVVPVSDFGNYHSVASKLVNGNLDGNNYISFFPHVIGYPAVLSMVYRIFGAEVIVAQLLNIVLSCGTVFLIYLIGKRIVGERCGFIAALLWALWPSQIFYNSLVATEHLFTFINLICILIFYYIYENNKNYYKSAILFILLGVLCAILNAIRPLGLLMIIAMGIFYFVFAKNTKIESVKDNLVRVVIFIFLPIFFFITSNFLNFLIVNTLGQDIAKSPMGFSIFVGSNIEYNGVWNYEDSNVFNKLMKDKEKSPQEVQDELLRKGIARFKYQSFQNVNLLIRKHKVMWSSDDDVLKYINSGLDKEKISSIDFIKNYNRLNFLCNIYYYIMLVLVGISAFIVIKKKNNYEIIFLYIIISGIIALHMITEVAGRYHFPAISIFAIIASYSLINSDIILKKEDLK
ncbi:glycosyltransferase family 39 protein [Herbivorax sp. ANBcel31]|uniref:ArnT family glycosyltransferase n=1 Tax=Herbivorax sp. ANBcel31 TaxID=3069754 RepID=UPI0027B1CE3E|nr:glycosyltransferase family 39 protein [Herbivorax sp. ANBcel31]MDQ2084945.1 glycosyltransferase family 39 protein [Herbivorax sp. ANBcel31]